MTRICSWCGKVLGFSVKGAADDGLITHSICPDCAEKAMMEVENEETTDH